MHDGMKSARFPEAGEFPSTTTRRGRASVVFALVTGRMVWLLFVLCGLLTGMETVAQGAAGDQPVLHVSVGVQNTYKVGCWTRLRLVASGLSPGEYHFRALVLDADGNQVAYTTPVHLVKGADHEGYLVEIPIRVGRIQSDVVVQAWNSSPANSSQNSPSNLRLVATQRIAPSQMRELTQSNPWIVAVGEVGGIDLTEEFVRGLQVTQVESLRDLSGDSLLWQGIDALFLPARFYPDSEWKTVREWVQAGGLLVTFPEQPAEAFLKLPLVSTLPIQFEGSAQTRDLSRLVSFVGEPSPLRTTGITMPRIVDAPGKTLVGGLSGPVITQSPWGFGQITLVALNLNERTFQNWDALPQLYRLLAQLPLAKKEDSSQQTSGLLTQNGLTDVKTQWDAALSDFGVQTPSVWLPLGGLLLAALLVGPLDYFLVRHLTRKPLLTWISLPILVLVAAGWGLLRSPIHTSLRSVDAADAAEATQGQSPLAVASAAQGLWANQAEVIDYAVDTGQGRYSSYLTFLSPETGRYDVQTQLELPVTVDSRREIFGPGAVPEMSFRGYYRVSATHFDQTSYQVAPLNNEAWRVPIYESSTAMMEVHGLFHAGGRSPQIPEKSQATEASQAEVTPADSENGNATSTEEPPAPPLGMADLRDDQSAVIVGHLSSTTTNQLRGEFTHHLDSPLTEWMLVYGKLLFFVTGDQPHARWEPGQVLQFPSSGINQKELSAFLMGTTTQAVKRTTGVGEDLLVRRQPYDMFRQDLAYILQRLTFRKALGSSEYTSLTNVELKSWDLTPQLELNQAILIGRLNPAASRSLVDGQPVRINKHERFVRITIPVEQRRQLLDRLPELN